MIGELQRVTTSQGGLARERTGLPGHVVTLTAHGDIEFVNQQWPDYLGKTIDEVKSELKCWAKGVVHPDDLSRLVATWSRSVETGQPYDYECRFCRADGVFRWFHVRAILGRDAEGRIVRWYSLRTDIDERKQAEDRLQLLLNVTNQVVSNLHARRSLSRLLIERDTIASVQV
jgi:PAS domain S-box-containing protein